MVLPAVAVLGSGIASSMIPANILGAAGNLTFGASGNNPVAQSGIGSLLQKFGGAANIGNFLGSAIGGYLGGRANQKAAQAYNQYLTNIARDIQGQLKDRAAKYENKLRNQFNEAEPQYQQEAYTQLPELTQLVNDIANQSAEAQRQNQRQINASLAQQGVRGGQASILANRATGELNRNLQRDINQTVYDEARNRQNSRLGYYSQKALTPWQTMAGAFGNSLTGANNALSGAQAGIYSNAYNRAMGNFGNTQKVGGLF